MWRGISRNRTNGNRINGSRMSGSRMSGSRMNGRRMSGSRMSRSKMTENGRSVGGTDRGVRSRSPRIFCMTLLSIILFASTAFAEGTEGPTGTEISEGVPVPTETRRTEQVESKVSEGIESWAAGSTESTESTEHAANERVYLGIDTVHIYENMDSSYSQGYIPKIENGVVHLVVPFLASGPLQGDRLTVELDMGENAPFVYANYRKEVRKEDKQFDGFTEPVQAYVFCCDIALESNRKNGKYPVTVRAVGYSQAGYRAELSSRIFVTVTDGADTPPGGAGTEKPPEQTESAGPDTEKPSGDDPPVIVPDDPNSQGNPSGSGNEGAGQDGQPNAGEGNSGQSIPGETDPGQSGAGEIDSGQSGVEPPGMEIPLTVEPSSKEADTEKADAGEALPADISSGSGYSGGSYGSGDDSGGTEKIHRQPKFLLVSDSLAGKQLTAGQEYEFTTVFQNMTGNEPVYNMKVTLKTESEAVECSCFSFYFGKVGTQETVSLPTCLSVKPNAQAGKVLLTFTFDYENDQGTAYTAAEEVELDVYQPSQLVLEGFRLAPQLYATDTVDSSFAVHNAGKAVAYNVEVEFAGQGLFATGSVFAGDLEAGASYEDELRIYVGNKAMKSLSDTGANGKTALDGADADNAENGRVDTDADGAENEGEDTDAKDSASGGAGTYDGDSEGAGQRNAADVSGNEADEMYGQTTGTLTLTYEDAYGEVYTQTQEFATEILEPQIVTLSVEKPEEQTNQWQAAILTLFGAVFVLTLVLMGWRLRKSKNALADLLAAQRERNA